MKISIVSLLSITIFILISCRGINNSAPKNNILQYANPRYATERPGNCVIGPQMPWGSINPSPDTKEGGTDGYSKDSPIKGFSQLHVHGTGGLGHYGNILISPQIGLNVNIHQHFSDKDEEEVSCGYYKVKLARYDILSELTCTRHSAIYKFTFPKSDNSNIIINLAAHLPRDNRGNMLCGMVKGSIFIDKQMHQIFGKGTFIGGWTGNKPKQEYNVYFVAKFSKIPDGFGTWVNDSIFENNDRASTINQFEPLGTYFKYSTSKDEEIYVKISISMQSIDNARSILSKEIPGFDFDKIKEMAEKAWNDVLGTIIIEDNKASQEQLEIFYSNLYHTMVMPRNRTGDNPWSSNAPYYDDQYTTWDTYRTVFPLLSILKESVFRDNVLSYIDRFNHFNSYVADAFISGKNYGDQGGNNIDVVIAEAFNKNVEGINWEEAYEILKYHAEKEREPHYLKHGWVPVDSKHVLDWQNRISIPRSCSRTLEFAYNDFCVSQVAKGLGYMKDKEEYLERSRNWIELWDKNTESDGYYGFIRPKTSNGRWIDIDVKERKGWRGHFYEGTSWQYSYYLPHDFHTMVEKMGGNEQFVERTVHYFESGLHSWANEPTFLTARTFIYAGRPDLTSKYVREGMKKWTLKRVPGNDDSGAMGAWYVFSAMGFFPLAGQDLYLINGPLFQKITIRMENGNKITIIGNNASPDNIYIQSAKLNGKQLQRAWFRHSEITEGATFEFEMGPSPSNWGRDAELPILK